MPHADNPTAAAPAASRNAWLSCLVPGLVLVVPLAVMATAFGRAFPVIGGPVAGVTLGVLLAAWLQPVQRRPGLSTGVKFASGRVLQAAVVLLGAQVSIPQVLRSGWESLPVMLGTLAACLGVAWLVGRALRIDSDLTTLIGVGTAICGASAIAATTTVIKPAATKVTYALSTIFLFNVIAVVTFPAVGHALGMSQEAFGLFAGTAVNDTSSVVAAAAVYGQQATDTAVVVKLTRTLMIIPIVVGLAFIHNRRDQRDASRPGLFTLVPWFLIGFLLLAAVNSVLPIPDAAASALRFAAVFLITVALTAIGLSTDLAGIRRTGATPLVLGFVLWLTVTASSLVLQWLTTAM